MSHESALTRHSCKMMHSITQSSSSSSSSFFFFIKFLVQTFTFFFFNLGIMKIQIFILISSFFFALVFSFDVVRDKDDSGFEYINTDLVNKTDSRWQTKKLIMCTDCTLESGTIVAFQAFFRNAATVKPLQFSLWTPDLQGMELLTANSSTRIYSLLMLVDYDPAELGKDNSVGCNDGVHTVSVLIKTRTFLFEITFFFCLNRLSSLLVE